MEHPSELLVAARLGMDTSPMGHMTFAAPKLGPAQKAEVVESIYTERGLPNAAQKAHVSLRSVMEALDEDEDFALAVNRALNHLTSVGEQEMMRRAIDGVENYVTSQGKIVMVPDANDPLGLGFVPLVERKYSDALLKDWMKARARDTFGDKVEVQHKHSGHIAVPLISKEDLLRALESGQSLDFTPQSMIDQATDAEFEVITDQRETVQELEDSEPDFGEIDREKSLEALTKIMCEPPKDENEPDFGEIEPDFDII